MQQHSTNHSPEAPSSLYDLTISQEENLLKLTRLANDIGRQATHKLALLSIPVLISSVDAHGESLDTERKRNLIARQLANIPALAENYDPEEGRFVTYVSNYAVNTGRQYLENPTWEVPTMKAQHSISIQDKSEPKLSNKMQVLFEKLGFSFSTESELTQALSKVTDQQAKYIRAYYLSDDDTSWRSLAEELGCSESTARTTAKEGIKKIKQYMEEERQKSLNPNYITHREREFYSAIGSDPLSKAQLQELLESLTPTQAKYIRDFYLSGKEEPWRAIGERYGLKGTTAKETSYDGLKKLRDLLQERKERQSNPNYLDSRALEFFEKIGLMPTTLAEAYLIIEEGLTIKQKNYLTDYFLSGQKLSWEDISKKYGLSDKVARTTAYRAITKIRKKLNQNRITFKEVALQHE